MSDLRELYQEVIVDHSKRPRNFKKLETANRWADGFNPLCGDKVTVYLTIKNGIVEEAAFEGAGCAISMASASMMTESLKHKTEKEALELFERFHALVTRRPDSNSTEGVQDFEEISEETGLGKLSVFSGVCEFPARVKCASLAWHAVKTAIKNEGKVASTE